MIGAITAGLVGVQGTAAPAPLAGYSLWLDASDAATFTYSSGTVVSQWNDKSANAYNFTQATVGYQPSRNATQNSLSAVTFGSKFMYNSLLDWGSSNSTLFLVAKEDKTLGTGYMNLVTTGSGSTGQWGYGVSDAGAGDNLGLFDIGQAFTSFGTSMTNGNADVLAFKTSGISAGQVTAYAWKNATAVATQPQTITSTTSAAGIVLGSNSALNESFFGYVCEVILYPSQLSDADRITVQSYLKTKWGTP